VCVCVCVCVSACVYVCVSVCGCTLVIKWTPKPCKEPLYRECAVIHMTLIDRRRARRVNGNLDTLV